MKNRIAVLIGTGMMVGALSLGFAMADETIPATHPSPAATSQGGKNVRAKIEEPKKSRPVGVRAADPSQNGKVNTSGALSPLNESSMGAGIQIDLGRPKKVVPHPTKKPDAAEESSQK
jgi:hypothetical protein